MPRRPSATAIPGDAPTTSTKPKRKRRSVRKNVSNNVSEPPRRRSEAKAKRSKRAPRAPRPSPALLPRPQPVPLLTYAGRLPQIGADTITTVLPSANDRSHAPQFADARSADTAHPCRPATATPASPPPSGHTTARQRRRYSIDPRTVTKIGITGAILAAVLLMARISPPPPNHTTIKQDATTGQEFVNKQDLVPTQSAVVPGIEAQGADDQRTATYLPRPVHHPNFAGRIRSKRNQHSIARVRIIDAPAPMRQRCTEQTWPYIADYCLTVAHDEAAPSPPVAIAAVASGLAPPPAPRDAARGVATAPALTIHESDADSDHDVGHSVAESDHYRAAALTDQTPAASEDKKSEPAHRAEEPARERRRHDEAHRHEPRQRHVQWRQAATESARPARVRAVYAARRPTLLPYYARPWPRPEFQFAGGPPAAVESGWSHAPWY